MGKDNRVLHGYQWPEGRNPRVGTPLGASGKTGPLRGLWVAHLLSPLLWKRTHLSEAPEEPSPRPWEPFRGSKGPLGRGFRDPKFLKRGVKFRGPEGAPKPLDPWAGFRPSCSAPRAAIDMVLAFHVSRAVCFARFESVSESRVASRDSGHKGCLFLALTAVAEISTELIHFAPKVCENCSVMEILLGDQGKSTPSMGDNSLLTFPQVCLCNGNYFFWQQDSVWIAFRVDACL